MKKILLSLSALLISSTAIADSVYVGYGLGTFNSAKNSASETKIGQVGYLFDLYGGTYLSGKVGYWGDGSGNPTRKSSAYLSSGVGLLIDLRPIEIRSGWSLAFITTPDSYLGGRFPQFNGELYLGLRDKSGNGIGVQCEHISSAGLITPNAGRDFCIVQLSNRW